MRITYRSHTILGINISLPMGGHKRIEFTPNAIGTSEYTTEDKDEQDGLSTHHFFNSVFWIEKQELGAVDTPSEDEAEKGGLEESAPIDGLNQSEVTSHETMTIKVSGLADAREYLADHYGIDKTSLKSKVAILAKARELNINFAGIE